MISRFIFFPDLYKTAIKLFIDLTIHNNSFKSIQVCMYDSHSKLKILSKSKMWARFLIMVSNDIIHFDEKAALTVFSNYMGM